MAPTLSSVTATSVTSTAEKWVDIMAPAIAAQNQLGVIWELSGVYLRTGDNGVGLYTNCPFAPGSKITGVRAEYQGENAADGISIVLVKRASLAGAWTTVNPIEAETPTWTGAAQAVIGYTYSPETVVAGTVYAIQIVSVVASTGTRLFRVGFKSSQREL